MRLPAQDGARSKTKIRLRDHTHLGHGNSDVKPRTATHVHMEVRDRGCTKTDYWNGLPRILRTTRRRTKQSVGQPGLERSYAGACRSVRYARSEDGHRNDEVPRTTGAVHGDNETRGVPPIDQTFHPAPHRDHARATRSLSTTKARAGALGSREGRVSEVGGQRNHPPVKKLLVISTAHRAKKG